MWLCMVNGHWSTLLYNRYTVLDDWSVSLVARRTQVIWKDKVSRIVEVFSQKNNFTAKNTAGVAPVVNLRNLLHAGDEAHK